MVAIGEVFSSKGPIRILKVLTEIAELHVSERRTGSNYSMRARFQKLILKV